MRTLFILGALSFLVNLGYGIVLPVLPTLAAATAFDVGTMYSAFSATKLVAQLIGGAGADRFGAAILLRVGVLLYGVSLAGLALAHTVAIVLVFRVVEGIAVGICVPAMSAIVLGTSDTATFTKRHGIVLGIGGAGMVSGPVVGVLVGHAHVRAAMVVIAVATGLAALLAPSIERSNVRADAMAFEPRALLRYASSPAFILLVLPLAYGKLAFGVMQPLVPMHAAHAQLGDRGVALLFALTGILFAATQPVVGALRARFSPRIIAFACVLASATCFVSMARFDGPIGFSVAYLTYVVFGSMLFAANSGLVGEMHRDAESDHGKIFGAMHSVTDASMLLGPPLLLSLYAVNAPASFLALGALGVGIGCAFLWGTRARV